MNYSKIYVNKNAGALLFLFYNVDTNGTKKMPTSCEAGC
jgi:hypothetical protein